VRWGRKALLPIAILGVLLATASLAKAQSRPEISPEFRTFGALNCRFWNVSPVPRQLGYLLGVQDGLARTAFPAGQNEEFLKVVAYYYPKSWTSNGELLAGITEVCGQPANASVPIAEALHIFALRVNGADPAEIEKEIARERKLASMDTKGPEQK
jgi:hypothetical protein